MRSKKSKWTPDASLSKLEAWASAIGGRVKKGAPLEADAIDAIPGTIKPYFGKVAFAPPPTYRAFLAVCSSLTVQIKIDGEWETVTELEIYSPKGVKKVTRDTVHMPKGVEIDEGHPLTTNHLIGFAGTPSSPDCTLCFDTRRADASGEYPIIMHDQDEPVYAVLVADGRPSTKKAPKPKAIEFGAWFDEAVARIVKKKASQLDV